MITLEFNQTIYDTCSKSNKSEQNKVLLWLQLIKIVALFIEREQVQTVNLYCTVLNKWNN